MKPTAAARLVTLSSLLLSLLLSSGCSWMFVTEVPEHHEQLPYFTCTSGKAAPIIDSAAAVLYGSAAAAAASDNGSSDSSYDYSDTTIAVMVGIAVVDVASAIYGFRHTSECADAEGALALRLQKQAQEQRGRPAAVGCVADVDCKGVRICVSGECVFPDAPPPPPPPPPAAPSTPPPAAPAPAAPVPAAAPPSAT